MIEFKKLDSFNFALHTEIDYAARFKYQSTEFVYNYREGKNEWEDVERCLFYKYDKHSNTHFEMKFRIGFLPHVYKMMADVVTMDNFNYVQEEYRTELPEINVSRLRDYQIDDLCDMLTFRRGIFQCFTGYGKSEIIALLMDYCEVYGHPILIITPGTKERDEIKSRYRKNYNREIPEYFDETKDLNVINANGFVRSNKYKSIPQEYWDSIKWILADEVEATVSDSGWELATRCVNVERMYGFSATADGKMAEPLLLTGTFTEALKRNISLVSLYGPTVVYKRPSNHKIELVKMHGKNIHANFDNLDNNNLYNDILKRIFINDEFVEIIDLLGSLYPSVYIPINRTSIIDYWISKLDKKKYNIYTISSRGYQHETVDGAVDLTLDDLKNLVKYDKVDFIFATKSGYKALDLPELKDVFMVDGTMASAVLQYIGRVSRLGDYRISYYYPPFKLPSYSKHLSERLDLIHTYFSQCTITHTDLDIS